MAQQAALLGQVDDAGPQGPGQARAGLGPLGGDGEHAVDPALDPGAGGCGLRSADRRYPDDPFPLGGVVVDGTLGVTARAAHPDRALMVDPFLVLEPHLEHDAGALDSQQTSIGLLEVVHGRPSPRAVARDCEARSL